MMKSRPLTPKLAFASDNTSTMSVNACAAFLEAQKERYHAPYGNDRWTRQAEELCRELFELDSILVSFVPTGTAANCLGFLQTVPAGSGIVASARAHIVTDERGAPHFFTGNAVLPMVANQGRIDASDLEVLFRRSDSHYSSPSVVTITQSTELGTVYSAGDMQTLREQRRRLGFRLHIDGARFANALAHLGARPKELTWLQDVDFMSLGVTKNGSGLGEAIIFFDPELGAKFISIQKQAGQLMSKMWMATAPIVGLLRGGQECEFLTNAMHSNEMAQLLAKRIRCIFNDLDGTTDVIAYPVEANAVFVKLRDDVLNSLRTRGWVINDFIGGNPRLMCSWATTHEDIEDLVADLAESIEQAPKMRDRQVEGRSLVERKYAS
ncbi:MAG: Threonine aldolase [Planctomycetaceae bacterium]|nr:Threonine aldolase [Planctomycetaceae bacterium]